MSITMKPITSSNALAMGYDPISRQLHIQYPGRRVVYGGVPPALHADLEAANADPARSFGKELHAKVKVKTSLYPWSNYEEPKSDGKGK